MAIDNTPDFKKVEEKSASGLRAGIRQAEGGTFQAVVGSLAGPGGQPITEYPGDSAAKLIRFTTDFIKAATAATWSSPSADWALSVDFSRNTLRGIPLDPNQKESALPGVIHGPTPFRVWLDFAGYAGDEVVVRELSVGFFDSVGPPMTPSDRIEIVGCEPPGSKLPGPSVTVPMVVILGASNPRVGLTLLIEPQSAGPVTMVFDAKGTFVNGAPYLSTPLLRQSQILV